MKNNAFQILLYYRYVHLENPDVFCKKQRLLCEKLNLKGRIILAEEGINGTLEGKKDDTEKYILEMDKITEFKGISYKKSTGTGSAFPKLSVKVRSEIVATHIEGIDPTKLTGKYISADELHSWFEQKKEFYIVDMRNDYEYLSGYFDNFIPSGMRNFYDLKEALPRLMHLKNKTIVTVCTGGIRCEKASGFLLQNGFSDVYQLQDGIQSYMEKYPNKHFKGKLYVFDKRLIIGFHNEDAGEIVGKCTHCGKKSENYVNCEYNFCHFHFISCQDCLDKETGFAFCKTECKETYLRKRILA